MTATDIPGTFHKPMLSVMNFLKSSVKGVERLDSPLVIVSAILRYKGRKVSPVRKEQDEEEGCHSLVMFKYVFCSLTSSKGTYDSSWRI